MSRIMQGHFIWLLSFRSCLCSILVFGFYAVLVLDITLFVTTFAFMRPFGQRATSASGRPCNTVGALADIGCPCRLIGTRCQRPFSVCRLANDGMESGGGICQCDRHHYFDPSSGLCRSVQSQRVTPSPSTPTPTRPTAPTCPTAAPTPAPITPGPPTVLDEYYDACASVPRGLRDMVGCPVQLRDDSTNPVGYEAIPNKFVNGDLRQSAQLFEGDIRVASITYDIIAAAPSTSAPARRKRQASNSSDTNAIVEVCSRSSLWPGGVPYVIDSAFSADNASYIVKKMCAISQKTCVTFYPRTTETDYVKIVNQLGCWSFVGRQGGRQLLSLQIAGANNRTCLTGTVVEHELMHTLGFVHEQSRLDRDTYIDIDLNNVDPAFQNNFLKYNRKFVVDVPYDTTSIMHYNSEAFALNLSLPVITRKNNASARISAAEIVSDLDYEKISSLYSCPQNTSLVLQPVIPAETVYSASPYTSTSCDPVEGSGISPPRGTDDATLTPDPTGADTCVLFGSGGGGGRG